MKLRNLITKLTKRNLTVAAAESASGGYLSYLLTKTPGSSKIFKGALVVYSFSSKQRLFGLSEKLLTSTQAVSATISRRLAQKVRTLLNADIGLAIVGFAGPGAPPGAKTGTVFLAVSLAQRTVVKKFVIKGTRDTIRKRSAVLIVDMLNRIIQA